MVSKLKPGDLVQYDESYGIMAASGTDPETGQPYVDLILDGQYHRIWPPSMFDQSVIKIISKGEIT